ncbi:MAG: ABC transporter ATP-binding protein [Candidatus Rokubacteria bacterium RIFCSPLOWO2_12_FULL_69_21]|nr:MAG: ABC transporter ATP-binding protein [Candidatus Rokubacteria bacterium RIFCSPHIGHO2_02_FULL_69_13]OGL21687.1 MAG: ABC transporter ATP-binding protein [Candidatus Rokubacteria bacterium RIFCSPLOWO2_12_FULL_69_21]
MLEVRGVSTRYGQISMLRNVSVALGEGEIVCLLGPNGAGKTTLIRTILGIVRPVAGSLLFRGEPIDGLRTDQIVKRGIGVVPEGRRIFPKMTVEENLRMGAFAEWGSPVVASQLEQIFDRFPRLKERRRQIAATMSGGEQAMLAIGRALMGRPRLLLLDEPSLGLSPLLVEQIFEMIQAINRQGTTVFLVEQNARKTLALAHHGYLLQKGEIVGAGTAAELGESDIVRHAYLRA